MVQTIKNLPGIQETWVWSLGQEDPLVPTPVFLPGEFHGQRSLEDYSTWSRKELDTTEQLISANIFTSVTQLKWIPKFILNISLNRSAHFNEFPLAISIRSRMNWEGRKLTFLSAHSIIWTQDIFFHFMLTTDLWCMYYICHLISFKTSLECIIMNG